MERIRAFFVQKFGPLPVWAWAGIILALVLGYMYWKKIGIFAASTAAPSSSTTGSGGAPSSLDSTGGGGSAGGGDTAPPLYTPVSGNGSAGLLPSAQVSDISGSSLSPTAAPVYNAPVTPVSNYTSSPLYRNPVYPVEAAGTGYLPSAQPVVAFNPVRARSSGNQAIA